MIGLDGWMQIDALSLFHVLKCDILPQWQFFS